MCFELNLKNPPFPAGDTEDEIRRSPFYCLSCYNLYSGTASTAGIRRGLCMDEISGTRYAKQAMEAGIWKDLEPEPAWASSSRIDYTAWEATTYFTDIDRSAKSGCASCLLLKTILSTLTNASLFDDPDLIATMVFRKGAALHVSVGRTNHSDDSDSDLFSGLGPKFADRDSWEHIGNFELYILLGQDSLWPTIGCSMTFAQRLTDPLPGGLARHISRNAGSESCFTLIKHWLKTCIAKHTLCRQADLQASRQGPKRVIQVGSEDNTTIRVLEHPQLPSMKERPPYLALSHCWGQSVHLTLEKRSLAQRKENIAWENLPRTFQDAILVTRRLGFEFLWIDSLCIIQDDDADWEAEAAKMASIYDGASLVIAATAAVDGDSGFLFEREPYIEVQVKSHEGKSFEIFARRQLDHRAFYWGGYYNETILFNKAHNEAIRKGYPLFERAWCFQERLLATRMLHFTNNEIIFDCLTGISCECGTLDTFTAEPLHIPRHFVKLGKPSNPVKIRGPSQSWLSPFDRWASSPEGRIVDESHISNIWRDIVMQYSRKSMTKPSDGLPALAGVANKWSRNFNVGGYFAGLWTKDLLNGLLWESNAPIPYRSSEYRAPTWSWVSARNTVSWGGMDFGNIQYFVTICEENSSCLISGQDPFGKINSGWLFITGQILKMKLEKGNQFDQHRVVVEKNGYRREIMHDDSRECEQLLGQTVYCLRFSTHPRLLELNCGLILAPISASDCVSLPNHIQSHPNVFQRIGILRKYRPDDFDHDTDSEQISMYLV